MITQIIHERNKWYGVCCDNCKEPYIGRKEIAKDTYEDFQWSLNKEEVKDHAIANGWFKWHHFIEFPLQYCGKCMYLKNGLTCFNRGRKVA